MRYELKYAMMLTQCLARWALHAAGPFEVQLKEALRRAEEVHDGLYGGGGRHFVRRFARRLQEVYAAAKGARGAGWVSGRRSGCR